MHLSRSLMTLVFATVVLCGAAFADSTFNFGANGNGDIGQSDTFTAGGDSITLWGFTGNASNPNTDLWYKTGGGDETGLGLLNDPSNEHEIVGSSFIQFTAAGIKTITLGSVQSGESFALYGSNTLGTLGTLLTGYTGTADGTVNLSAIDGTWKYVSVLAPKGNVLLDSATVPEPGTLAMMITLGVVGLFTFGRSKLGRLAV